MVNQDKEVNMPLKEIDRDVEVLTASALLSRLWHIEADIKYMKESIEAMSNTQEKMWEYLDEVEDHVMMPWNFTELMEDQKWR